MDSNQYLATEGIGKLMLRFSVPCIMSLIVSALYNIVDQIFIGWGVGYLGNGATNVVFPITVISLALALMIGDGCAAYLSLCLGQKRTEDAADSVGNAALLSALVGLVMALLFWIFKEQILLAFGATENNIAYAREYFDYIILGIPFYVFGNAVNSIIRADGSPAFAMVSTLVGCIMNVILDPVAIFILGWGMRGAALATIAGQIVTAILGVGYLAHAKSFSLIRDSFKLQGRLLKSFLPLGISSFLTQISIVITMFVMNNTLVVYGAASKYGADIPLTVVGIVMKVYQIVISVVIGIAAGCQPIIGYNYGLGAVGRVRDIYKIMLKTEIIVGMISMLLFELFPLQIISIFGSESGLYNEFAVITFRIYMLTIIIGCVQKSTSVFLQAIGCPMLSMSLSLLKDFIVSVPAIIILPYFLGVTGAVWSAPLADIISLVAVILFMKHVWAGKLANKEEKKAAKDTIVSSVCLQSAK